jgi:ribosomal-protein-alanine N-acetyltransferase
MVIRQETMDDWPALWGLHQKTRLSPFHQSDFGDWLNHHTTWIAVCEGQLAGFLVIQDTLDHQDVLLLAVDPLYRRQGVARSLIQSLCPLKKPLFVEVEDTNTAALNLYQTLGFQPIGRRHHYYGAGRHALVMRLA